jgi:hypothetical protein
MGPYLSNLYIICAGVVAASDGASFGPRVGLLTKSCQKSHGGRDSAAIVPQSGCLMGRSASDQRPADGLFDNRR